jgi:hypothetical protein
MIETNGNGATPGPTPTPAAEFRRIRERGEIIPLPTTGRVVRMRIVKPSALLKLGKIPDPLTELVIKILYGQVSPEQYAQFFELADRREHAEDLAESFRVVCTAALIEPKVVDNPQADDEIHIDDLEDSEQRYIFDLALLEATGLSRFCKRQAELMESMDEGASAPLPAERVAQIEE